jgi:hypothetical protein
MQFHKQWLRFRIYHLLGLMVIVAAPVAYLGIQIRAANTQKAVVKSLVGLGFGVVYDHQSEHGGESSFWRPQFLRNLFGEYDFFDHVIRVSTNYVSNWDPVNTRVKTAIPYLRKLSYPFSMELNDCGFTDSMALELYDIASLQTLSLSKNPLSSSGLTNLDKLPGLECLILDECKLSPDAVFFFRKLIHLKVLSLRKTGLTPDDIENLRMALPSCTIEWE